MPRANRVDPFGVLIATPARGSLMGNRGCLHDAQGRIVRGWARKAWVTCLLEFKGRQRRIMAPGQYTELFFLDEATALAAGHRPCGTCRKTRYEAFKGAWSRGNADRFGGGTSSIQDIDSHLHVERIASGGTSRLWQAGLEDLPDGVFVVLSDEPRQALLWWQGSLHAWDPQGYGESRSGNPSGLVTVLTPRSTVSAIGAGFAPSVHESAKARGATS